MELVASPDIAVANIPETRSRAPRLPALTSLRFVAAAMIVVWHMRGSLGVPEHFAEPVILGHAVAFFYVLSGFILAYVYPSLSAPGATRRFIVARIARLWPAHLATLLLFLILLRQEAARYPFSHLVANAAMVHAWIPDGQWFFSFNGDSWSISCEFGFYLMFLVLIRNWRRTWWAKLAGVILVGCGMSLLAYRLHLPSYSPSGHGASLEGMIYINPLARVSEFVVGMSAALLWKWLVPRLRLGLFVGTLVELAAIGAVMLSLFRAGDWARWIGGRFGPAGSAVIGQWLVQGPVMAPAFAALIIGVALERGIIARALSARGALLLGEISYSVYLVHNIILHVYYAHGLQTRNIPSPLAIVVYWAIVLLSAHLLWVFVERPGRRFLVWLGSPRRRVEMPRVDVRAAARAWRWPGAEGAALVLLVFAALNAHFAPPVIHAVASPGGTATAPDLRGVVFSGRFRVQGADVEWLDNSIALRLAWQSVGMQRLVYTVVIQPLDAKGNALAVYSQPQDQLERTAEDGVSLAETFVIPPEIAANTHSVGVVLYRNPPEYLVANRGPRDNNNRRLLVPVPDRPT